MNLPIHDEERYSLEVVARLSGVEPGMILHYKEEGLIRPLPSAGEAQLFDDDALRTLRRIDHLRSELGLNDSGLRLILNLMDEVDRLQQELRARR